MQMINAKNLKIEKKFSVLFCAMCCIVCFFASITPRTAEASKQNRPNHYNKEYGEGLIRNYKEKHKIAILAYGSLVNTPCHEFNQQTRCLNIKEPWRKSKLSFPVSLTKRSLGNTLTATIDNTSPHTKKPYYATSVYDYLPNARHNIAAREGIEFRDNKYNLQNIFYIKKTNKCNNEETRLFYNWCMKKQSFNEKSKKSRKRLELSKNQLQSIAQWADKKKYTAVIWTGFSPTLNNENEALKQLRENPDLRKNTQNYINGIPEDLRTSFEEKVLIMD